MESKKDAEIYLDESLPPMTYRDLAEALEQVSANETHLKMVPYLVSGLHRQSPFLTGQMAIFEILRAGNCLADDPLDAPGS